MLADLKLRSEYEGLLYLADSNRLLQKIQSHHHVELEMNVVVQGTITYLVNGRRFTFSPRTLLWLFPGQEHELVDRADNARFYVAVFKPSLIRKSCHIAKYRDLTRKPSQNNGIPNTVLAPKSFELICRVMEWLMEGALDSDLLNRELGFGPSSDFHFEHHDPDALNAGLHHLLMIGWNCQLKGKAASESVTLHLAVRRAIKILGGCGGRQNLRDLASSCGVSQSHLSRIFHQQIGISLNQYRNSQRLVRFFEEYQRQDRKNLADAAYAAGFGSYAQFYQVFSQAYGCGPRTCLGSRLHVSPPTSSRVSNL